MTRYTKLVATAAAAGWLSSAGAASAQNALPPQQQGYLDTVQQLVRRVRFNQVVTSAPYSADVVSTVTQVLADGTRIEQSVSGKVYRDNAGRMRREQQVLGLGSLGAGSNPVTNVTITDPMTQTTYTINDRTQTATKAGYTQVLQWNAPVGWLTPFGTGVLMLNGEPAPPEVVFRTRDNQLLRGQRLPTAQPGLESGAAGQGTRQGGGGRGVRSGEPVPAPSSAARPESLGSRQMEGVLTTGTRTAQTIPTGQIGNDRPIVITDETWESPDLQIVVYSKHHDPRTGDVEYRLRNISRNDPAPDLFQVPAGYTIIDPLQGSRAGRNGGGRGAVPALPAPRLPGQ